jgi:hypothetical protein
MGHVFQHAEQYLDQLSFGEFVEIGTSRGGDNGSTQVLSGWATKQGTTLTTVDVDPDNCKFVQNLHIPGCVVINQSGEQYLQERIYGIRPIALLYLDNFDWDWHPSEVTESFVQEQQKRYSKLGLEMTNINSQSAHLTQMILALHHMASKSLVICDDTWYNKWWGHYSGKSGAVIPFLLANGYQVLYTEEQPMYGTILGKNIAVR